MATEGDSEILVATEVAIPLKSPPLTANEQNHDSTTRSSLNPTRIRYVRSQYRRAPYEPRPKVKAIPIVKHSEPRAVAAHVSQRSDRRVTALPPPKRKKRSGTEGRDDDGNDGQDQRKEGNEDDHGDGGKDNDRENTVALPSIEAKESDEEYESAQEELWPEDIWNESTENRIQEEMQRALKHPKPIVEQRKERKEDVRTMERFQGPGFFLNPLLSMKCPCYYYGHLVNEPCLQLCNGYQLFALGYEVWRFEGFLKGNFCHKIRVPAEKLVNAGWVWDNPQQMWHREGRGDHEKAKCWMDVLPTELGNVPEWS